MELDKDNDFDFEIYKEDNEYVNLDPNKKKSKFSTFRSKFSPGEFELSNLSILKSKISEYGIKVASSTDDISDLWYLYSCINNYWARIKSIFGDIIGDKVKAKDTEILDVLIKYAKEDSLDYIKLHCKLLEYRDMVFEYSQYTNLGIEVERQQTSKFKDAEDKIVQ